MSGYLCGPSVGKSSTTATGMGQAIAGLSLALSNAEKEPSKINAETVRTFFDTVNIANANPQELTDICRLAVQAAKMQLIGNDVMKKTGEKVSQIAVKAGVIDPWLDFTIRVKDGEVKVNSFLLRNNIEWFATMFACSSKEATDMSVDLKDIWLGKDLSKATIELIVECLQADPSTPISIPSDDEGVIFVELFGLAIDPRFHELISKLHQPLSDYIKEHDQIVVENFPELMMRWKLCIQSEVHKIASVAASPRPFSRMETELLQRYAMIGEINAQLVKYFELPTQPSSIEGKIEVPATAADKYFEAKKNFHSILKDVGINFPIHFHDLPVVLAINGPEGCTSFKMACKRAIQSNGIPEGLKSKISCSNVNPADIDDLKAFAAEHKIELTFEKVLLSIPPQTSVFGEEQWRANFGNVGAVPLLPEDIGNILRSPCPYWPGETVGDTHMLVLIPASVNGEPLTFNSFERLVQNVTDPDHKTGYRHVYDPIRDTYGNVAPQGSQWVLMTKDVIPESRDKSFAEQTALVKVSEDHDVPDFLTATVSILAHFVNTGVCLFSIDPWTYTRCKEQINVSQMGGVNVNQITVGVLAPAGLFVGNDHDDYGGSLYNGVAGLRKFF